MITNASSLDWASITASFAYRSLGREVQATKTYFQPLTYDAQNPAPTPDHQRLSELLLQLRPYVVGGAGSQRDEHTQTVIASLEAQIDAVKRRIWQQLAAPTKQVPGAPGLFD